MNDVTLKDGAAVKAIPTSQALIEDPLLNKGTAFSQAERDAFKLNGYFGDAVETLDTQVARSLETIRALPTNLDRYVYLRDLQDANETLYFAVITRNLDELLPMIYTPTVGAGCQQYHHIIRRPRGLFISYPNRAKMDEILANPRYDNVECIVVTDGERILGLGDQGVGGMGIPVGKLAIYTGCGGIAPDTVLPITLDTGTNNAERIADPLYFGWKHERIRGEEYDSFIDQFVEAVKKRWPNVLLQWEDFHKNNANRLLDKYRDALCTFNDDIQGTASVATGTLLSAIQITGKPLKDQRVAILGGGSAGVGIADLIRMAMVSEGLSDEEARKRFFIVGRYGLVTEKTPNLDTFQLGFRQDSKIIDGWDVAEAGKASLYEVIKNAKPTVLVGVAGQPGMFTEEIIREIGKHTERPIVFPLSNPTSCVEAQPSDIIKWTEGRAIIGTGSPFLPFEYEGKTYHFAQTNNSYIFPGVGLGTLAVGAKRVTDAMFLAAARALAELSPAKTNPGDKLLPTLDRMREVSSHIAVAVAKQAMAEGLAPKLDDAAIKAAIKAKVWEPVYKPLA
ncbi:NAD-dependent malic enzyme [uncultured Pleomorphomonas sp.]|nr:NAD-dependent malic enzyme [uncultured Pleomorphomonas sp.]